MQNRSDLVKEVDELDANLTQEEQPLYQQPPNKKQSTKIQQMLKDLEAKGFVFPKQESVGLYKYMKRLYTVLNYPDVETQTVRPYFKHAAELYPDENLTFKHTEIAKAFQGCEGLDHLGCLDPTWVAGVINSILCGHLANYDLDYRKYSREVIQPKFQEAYSDRNNFTLPELIKEFFKIDGLYEELFSDLSKEEFEQIPRDLGCEGSDVRGFAFAFKSFMTSILEGYQNYGWLTAEMFEFLPRYVCSVSQIREKHQVCYDKSSGRLVFETQLGSGQTLSVKPTAASIAFLSCFGTHIKHWFIDGVSVERGIITAKQEFSLSLECLFGANSEKLEEVSFTHNYEGLDVTWVESNDLFKVDMAEAFNNFEVTESGILTEKLPGQVSKLKALRFFPLDKDTFFKCGTCDKAQFTAKACIASCGYLFCTSGCHQEHALKKGSPCSSCSMVIDNGSHRDDEEVSLKQLQENVKFQFANTDQEYELDLLAQQELEFELTNATDLLLENGQYAIDQSSMNSIYALLRVLIGALQDEELSNTIASHIQNVQPTAIALADGKVNLEKLSDLAAGCHSQIEKIQSKVQELALSPIVPNQGSGFLSPYGKIQNKIEKLVQVVQVLKQMSTRKTEVCGQCKEIFDYAENALEEVVGQSAVPKGSLAVFHDDSQSFTPLKKNSELNIKSETKEGEVKVNKGPAASAEQTQKSDTETHEEE